MRHTLTFSLILAAAASLAALGACAGDEFKTANNLGVAGGAGTAGSGGGGQRCTDPRDCEDGDPCTVDLCGTNSLCVQAPKCGPSQVCCQGSCGECCSGADCDDNVACTTDQCYSGICAHLPDSTVCGSEEYCSISRGCQPKKRCDGTVEGECDDLDPCTSESCVDGFCEYPKTCPDGDRCCPDGSCGKCCDSTDCTEGGACAQGVCNAERQCEYTDTCAAEGKTCCEGTGTCAECCTVDQCPDDDGLACTTPKCTGGSCSLVICQGSGQVCQADGSCGPAPECSSADQCDDNDSCTTNTCSGGKCVYTPNACCSDVNCDDSIDCTIDKCNGGNCVHTQDATVCTEVGLKYCMPLWGGCVACKTSADCGVYTPLVAAPIGCGWTCSRGRCLYSTGTCPDI